MCKVLSWYIPEFTDKSIIQRQWSNLNYRDYAVKLSYRLIDIGYISNIIQLNSKRNEKLPWNGSDMATVVLIFYEF